MCKKHNYVGDNCLLCVSERYIIDNQPTEKEKVLLLKVAELEQELQELRRKYGIFATPDNPLIYS